MMLCMDSPALERLGHHVVSRRVALGYRNRTDLADSVQFTVRTLSDIEHGVRKASPGTYAMLENKLAWAPGSIDTILSGGEPNELAPTLHRTNPTPRPRDTHRARAPPTPCRRRPPRNCCWSCGGASSPRAADATTPGTTGTAASTHTATGPNRADGTSVSGHATRECRPPSSSISRRMPIDESRFVRRRGHFKGIESPRAQPWVCLVVQRGRPDPNPCFQAERHQRPCCRVDRGVSTMGATPTAPTRNIHPSSLPLATWQTASIGAVHGRSRLLSCADGYLGPDGLRLPAEGVPRCPTCGGGPPWVTLG